MARYLDLEGLQFFYTNLQRLFRTASQVDAQIDAKLGELKNGAYVVVESADWATATANPAAGTIYVKHTVVGTAPDTRDDYTAYAAVSSGNSVSLVPLTSEGQFAKLDAGGLIDPSVLPDLAITDVITKQNQTEFATFLTTSPDANKVGDVVVVTDGDGNGHPAYYMITGVGVADDQTTPTYTYTTITPASTSLSDLSDCAGYASGTDLSKTTTTTGKVVDPAGVKAIVDDYGYDTLIGNLQAVVNVDPDDGTVTCDSAVTAGGTKAVSGDAVKTYVDNAIDQIQTITRMEVDSLFVGANEIWVAAPAGWEAMDVQVESTGSAIAMTEANIDGYYVYDATTVANGADQLVFSNTDGTATLALEDIDTKAKIEALKGHILVVTASSDEFTAVPELPQA